jgi:hypothetical protein
MFDMTNFLHPSDVHRPLTLLDNFEDSTGAAFLLQRSRATLVDMVNRGLITRYRVGKAVLYFRPEILEVAEALRRLEKGSAQ